MLGTMIFETSWSIELTKTKLGTAPHLPGFLMSMEVRSRTIRVITSADDEFPGVFESSFQPWKAWDLILTPLHRNLCTCVGIDVLEPARAACLGWRNL